MTSFGTEKTTKINAWQMLGSYLCMQRGLVQDKWSFIGPGSEKKWYSMKEDSPQGIWDHITDEMRLEFAESGHPFSVQRLHCLGEISKANDMANRRFTTVPIRKQLRLFRVIAFANQFSLYGANISKYRKLATKTVYLQHEMQHER